MRKLLMAIGVIFIAIGFIYGVTQISDLKQKHKDMAFWEDSSAKNYSNNLIEQKAQVERTIYTSSLSLTLGVVLSGIISGIVFIALSMILRKLEDLIYEQERNRNEFIKEIKKQQSLV